MIPVQARLEIIRKKDGGETWTGISRWMEEEYGVTVHRTTIQRWYDKEVCKDAEVDQEELLESLDERVKIDKKVQTLKNEVSYYKKPTPPKWAYTVIQQQALYNAAASDLQHFELHGSEEESLVYRILMLAGLTIKQPDVQQAGGALIQLAKQEQNS